MRRRPPVAASKVVEDFPRALAQPPDGGGDDGGDVATHATLEVAKALNRLADEAAAMRLAVQPAVTTIHGFGARLDALCQWLGGKWPWVVITLGTVIFQTVSRAPEEAPRLIEALGSFLRAVT